MVKGYEAGFLFLVIFVGVERLDLGIEDRYFIVFLVFLGLVLFWKSYFLRRGYGRCSDFTRSILFLRISGCGVGKVIVT